MKKMGDIATTSDVATSDRSEVVQLASDASALTISLAEGRGMHCGGIVAAFAAIVAAEYSFWRTARLAVRLGSVRPDQLLVDELMQLDLSSARGLIAVVDDVSRRFPELRRASTAEPDRTSTVVISAPWAKVDGPISSGDPPLVAIEARAESGHVALKARGARTGKDFADVFLSHCIAVAESFGGTTHNSVVDFGSTYRPDMEAALSSPIGHAVSSPEGTALDLIADRVKSHPSKAALKYLDSELSYAELDASANQLANHLATLGVGTETRVGIILDRSALAVTAILAVLKAGGTYVPVDPGFPLARVLQILEHSEVAAVLTDERCAADLPVLGVPLVVIDRPSVSEGLRKLSTSAPPVGIRPDSAAYVIYTSGSTGEPKAVIGLHASIVSGMLAVPFDQDNDAEVCCLHTPLSVSFTVARLFLPLMCGKTLVVLREGVEKDFEELTKAWQFHNVGNIALMTPVLKQIVSQEKWRQRLKGVTTIAFGGELVSEATVRTLLESLPAKRLIHGYGATEVGVAAMINEMAQGSSDEAWSVGFPFPNTNVYILADDLTPMPRGGVGEVCIAAPHIARGYLKRPELTSQKFIDDPFGLPGRIYRTGDLGRRLPSGRLEMVGRTDDQVKVRGFRIELPEVELALRSHALVSDAAVAPHEVDGEVRLVGYVKLVMDASLTRDALRAFLAQRLPAFMIPSALVFVEHIPLASSGKVDRSALPNPFANVPRIAADSGLEADRAIIAATWAAELRLSDIRDDEHFLDLGGDSLIAMRIAAALSTKLDVDISPIAVLSDHPTIAELYKFVLALRAETLLRE